MDLSTNKCLNTLKGHSEYVTILIKLNNAQILSVGAERAIKIWNLLNGTCLQSFRDKFWYFETPCLIRLQKTRFIGNSEKLLVIWDINSDHCVKAFSIQNQELTNAIVKINKNSILTINQSNRIKLWSLDKGVCIKLFISHTKRVSSLIKLNSNEFASGSMDDTIKIWKINDLNCIRSGLFS